MDRRRALQLLAASAIAPRFLRWDADALIAGLRRQFELDGRAAPAPPTGPYQFQALDAHQRAMVAQLAEMIIPATDTPGAAAAQVDEFIDLMLAEWCSDTERADFLSGLATLDLASMQAYHRPFGDASLEQRTALLRALDEELTAARAARKAWKAGAGPRPPDHRKLFWHQMRSLTVVGYYASEVGFTLELQDVLIPGVYKACAPIEVR